MPAKRRKTPQTEANRWFFPIETNETFLRSVAREDIGAEALTAAHWRRACEDFFAETGEVEFAEPGAGDVAAVRLGLGPAMHAAITLAALGVAMNRDKNMKLRGHQTYGRRWSELCTSVRE